MLDDIAEGSIKAIFRFIIHLLFEIVFFYTGEIILYVISFGQKKPRWDYYAEERPTLFVLFSEISIFIGIAAWLFIFWFIGTKVLN